MTADHDDHDRCVTVDTVEHADAIAAFRAWVEYESRGLRQMPPMYARLLAALTPDGGSR